ncbi:MAG: hypothetical protein KF898_04230 [Parachlamydiales bacterium]|nr:hypothetical protein [Candidatus Acheromyda pituitae]
MLFPIVISFYTKDTFYQLEVQNLIASCEKFGIICDIEAINSFGSWEVNCAYKPFFIHKKLQELKQPVLWVDADAAFKKKPEELPVFAKDFAVRINAEIPIDHPSRVMSGTVYANYTAGADGLLRLWAKRSQQEINRTGRKEEFWDQISLRDALYCEENPAAFDTLPHTYTRIVDHRGDLQLEEEPVIEHYQASRRYKKLI